MSTINKILKTSGVSALCNGGTSFLENHSQGFDVAFIIHGIFSTLPALAVVGIDKFVNQNITSNKIIQYGLTAIESALILPGGISLFLQLSVQESFTIFFKALCSPSLEDVDGKIKLLTASTMV